MAIRGNQPPRSLTTPHRGAPAPQLDEVQQKISQQGHHARGKKREVPKTHGLHTLLPQDKPIRLIIALRIMQRQRIAKTEEKGRY